MTAPEPAAPVRCAIYTRKSSEEGLDQAFNSLDAQREACEAYALSQRHEGWQVLDTRYDDGGYSGGNMTRPALQRLLADIQAGAVDLVVVYKIDRLTRSLMDFSKLVEVFDQHRASFVSITQHFNTTSSMGRLTLNVLLSFAQFEREVTGERIRDKVAASKRKGMWMGGTVPRGYSRLDKTLVVDSEQAAQVRHIFERYLALGCVIALQRELTGANVLGRSSRQSDGSMLAGPMSLGGLYALLKNRLYLGEIQHRGATYPGRHEAIVPVDLWQQVQEKLESNRRDRKYGSNAADASLLAGMLVDAEGHRLYPSHTNKAGKRYRYYLSRTQDRDPSHPARHRVCLPAHDLERIATEQWIHLLTASDLDVQLGVTGPGESVRLRAEGHRLAERWTVLTTSGRREVLLKAGLLVRVDDSRVEVSADPGELAALLEAASPKTSKSIARRTAPRVTQSVEASLIKAWGETRILESGASITATALIPGHQSLLKSIALGRSWAKALIAGEITSIEHIKLQTGMTTAHVARSLKCLMIPPDVVTQLMEGRGPRTLQWRSVRPLGRDEWKEAVRGWRR